MKAPYLLPRGGGKAIRMVFSSPRGGREGASLFFFMRQTLLLLTFALMSAVAMAQSTGRANDWRGQMRATDAEFFQTEEARRIGDQMLLWQRTTGGWPKNIDMASPMSDEQREQVLKEKDRRDDSTTDNGATTLQMKFLARLYQATGEAKYRDGFRRGVEYLLSGQYKNGGWPQFWPVTRRYQVHITYNDDAMVNTMEMLRDMYEGTEPYGGSLCEPSLKRKLKKAFDKGVECILATQIKTDGQLTVWCQQHDR